MAAGHSLLQVVGGHLQGRVGEPSSNPPLHLQHFELEVNGLGQFGLHILELPEFGEVARAGRAGARDTLGRIGHAPIVTQGWCSRSC